MCKLCSQQSTARTRRTVCRDIFEMLQLGWLWCWSWISDCCLLCEKDQHAWPPHSQKSKNTWQTHNRCADKSSSHKSSYAKQSTKIRFWDNLMIQKGVSLRNKQSGVVPVSTLAKPLNGWTETFGRSRHWAAAAKRLPCLLRMALFRSRKRLLEGLVFSLTGDRKTHLRATQCSFSPQ